MRVLIWQWGRRGAGPLVAVSMAEHLAGVAGVDVRLSLSTGAELLQRRDAPVNDLPVRTYADQMGFAARILGSPRLVAHMARAIRAAKIDVAVCAMPAPLDFAMAAALRRAGVPYAVMVHDAERHPGDMFPLQMSLQRWLLRGAGLLFALSGHVAEQLRQRGLRHGLPLVLASLPPFVFGPMPAPVLAHGGGLRLLSFGRLLPYKGLDLLAEALELVGPGHAMTVRVVGSGPESDELARLRALPCVTVENRWVPEEEVGALLAWADALVLSHREASQSGVAAAAIAARRWVVATRVGGLAEQLAGQSRAILCDAEGGSLAEALGRLPSAMAKAAATGPEADSSWGHTAEGIVMALRGLVPGPAGSGTTVGPAAIAGPAG